jgi:hypothetical protein
VIINDFNIGSIAILETEAESPLIVDTDAPLSFAVVLQCFQPVGRRITQVIERRRSIKLRQPRLRISSAISAISP